MSQRGTVPSPGPESSVVPSGLKASESMTDSTPAAALKALHRSPAPKAGRDVLSSSLLSGRCLGSSASRNKSLAPSLRALLRGFGPRRRQVEERLNALVPHTLRRFQWFWTEGVPSGGRL